MAWGDRKKAQRREAVESGGQLSGRQARKAARGQGGLGDDGRVRNTKGKVTGTFSDRTRRRPNEHGV